MIKLKNILLEVLNTFQVEADLITDPTFSITDILNQFRGLRKVTIVNNITPEDYAQTSPDNEYHRLSIKFVTREDPKIDIEQFKKDILKSDMDKNDLRIPGTKSVKFRMETLKRL
tara:strand:+ start:1828 stop:2172 length:345 start_codon:yes stop_codon:yes gene_type:complete